MTHDELKATYQPGQRWETRREGHDVWVPVGYPVWDDKQEYRQVQTPQQLDPFCSHCLRGTP